MARKLFVGNLAHGVTDAMLSTAFEAHGTVKSAEVVLDRVTGASRGFGLVEMGTDEAAHAALKALDLKEIEGRCITVSIARPNVSSGSKRGRR